jgi:hypothetical protein
VNREAGELRVAAGSAHEIDDAVNIARLRDSPLRSVLRQIFDALFVVELELKNLTESSLDLGSERFSGIADGNAMAEVAFAGLDSIAELMLPEDLDSDSSHGRVVSILEYPPAFLCNNVIGC